MSDFVHVHLNCKFPLGKINVHGIIFISFFFRVHQLELKSSSKFRNKSTFILFWTPNPEFANEFARCLVLKIDSVDFLLLASFLLLGLSSTSLSESDESVFTVPLRIFWTLRAIWPNWSSLATDIQLLRRMFEFGVLTFSPWLSSISLKFLTVWYAWFRTM